MRIIKVADFENEIDLANYFNRTLKQLKPPGLFTFPRGIAENGLDVGDTLLFCYEGRIRYVAKAASKRLQNTFPKRDSNEPHCFLIDMKSVRSMNVQISEVERRLKKSAGLLKSLRGRGWTTIPESRAALRVIESLVAEFKSLSELSVSTSLQPQDANETDLGGLDAYKLSNKDLRKIVARQIRERRGQGSFRDCLCERYRHRCIVTGCNILAVLEAAHICPYRRENDNHSSNGLLLRADIHTLFDLDLLGINPDSLRVEVHPCIAKEYGRFAGTTLKFSEKRRPSTTALQTRYDLFLSRLDKR
jgi:HNH endonuclease